MSLCFLAVFSSLKQKNWPIFSFGLLFLSTTAIRHILQGAYSELPRAEKIYLWYQTFEYLYFGAFIASVALHALLLWTTSKAIKCIYVLMTINVCFYAYMHWQRNILGRNEPDWTWDLYTWTVVPINYIIVGILLFASIKGVKGRDGRSIS
ncbi:hypothetical protein [Thalassomonas haliotis]|uniref:EXPERA domain-containing protein n=1 Tax=Thalassomonas haliotis TaxID=485448 RepID=A0ABY7VGS9_9GAMM|nr:hypothetical protein [Thalassomonas haliotis]WDE12733.1 hypothetical protein H3N35_04485 [Thalassomonas haliotis]